MVFGRLIALVLSIGVICAWADEQKAKVHELSERPVFRVEVVEKVTTAVNYRHRSGATRVDFIGTPLMPRAKGTAKVESKQGYIKISARLNDMDPAIRFGAEYLTYVLWAITPEGRAANLGEILVKDGRGKLEVTAELQVFGMVITAEPYFAVRQPSDLVVLENEIRPDTVGKFEVIDAKYELLKRGQYKPLSNPLSLTVDPKIPLELYEARNAVQIARSTGADQYAADTFLKAERALRQSEAYHARDAGKKPVAMLAREAVQTAEDAREIAVQRREQERLRLEREAAAAREAAAKAAAEEEARKRAEAEELRRDQEEKERLAQERAEREARERRRLQAQLEEARREVELAEAEAERAMSRLKERTASFGEERARWEQERYLREEESAARMRRLQELERAELRVRIYSQLSRVLFTRDTENGLELELLPELFDQGAEGLLAEGREKLAMVAGILLAHPGLTISTVSAAVGEASETRAGNLELRRTEAVRGYLIERGLTEGRLWEAIRIEAPVVSEEALDLELELEGVESAAENPVKIVVSGPPIEVGNSPSQEPF